MNKSRFVVAAVGILFPFVVSAHIGTQSFEKQTDKYFADIGYDLSFQEGEETLMDFGLFTIKNGQPDGLASFKNITVTIHSGATVLYTRSIEKPEFGKAFATVTPDRHGHWILTADFSSDGKLLESVSFDLPIKLPDSSRQPRVATPVIFSTLILLIAIVIVAVFKRKAVSQT